MGKADPIKVTIVPSDVDGKMVARALFSLAVFATTIAVSIYLQRALSGPDVFTSIRMRVFRTVADSADAAGRYCHQVSAKADTLYLASRP